jgi:hypothetical protein
MASRPIRVKPSANAVYMGVVAAQIPKPSNKRAKQQIISQLSDLVRLLGADPVDDYGGNKTTVNDKALAHLQGVGAAIEAIADKLTEIADDSDTASAIAASGFTQYFAQYYCQTHKIDKRFPNHENLADKCNSQVIAPELLRMLNKVQK